MIAVTRKDFTSETVGNVKVLWLLKPNANRLQEWWACRCLLCNAECKKSGHALIVYPDNQCCERCHRRRHDGAKADNEREFMPTMHYIWDIATKEIQAEWSRKEEQSRRAECFRTRHAEIQRAGFKRR